MTDRSDHTGSGDTGSGPTGPGPADGSELAAIETMIDGWLREQVDENPVVIAVDRLAEEPRRWFVRINGEEKDVYTIRFHLRQRTLHFETYFMPAPEENAEQLFAHLLRRNLKMYGGSFVIGEEDAVFIQGHLDRSMISPEELDRVVGSIYAWVEQYFQPAIKIGFASRFVG